MVELKNTLYYGDTVDVLREYIPDESAELIYLEPPFNSKQAYNVIFDDLKGVAEREAGAEGQGLQRGGHKRRGERNAGILKPGASGAVRSPGLR